MPSSSVLEPAVGVGEDPRHYARHVDDADDLPGPRILDRVLATSPGGRTAPALAGDLYGDRSRVVTVRAELSRLRKQFGGMLAAQAYRFAASVDIEVIYPDDTSGVLPSSIAPAVAAVRRHQHKPPTNTARQRRTQ